MKKFQKTITVYELGNGFFVEVCNHKGTSEFYLCHEDYGIKELAFGVICSNEAEEAERVEQVKFYIEDYRMKYTED